MPTGQGAVPTRSRCFSIRAARSSSRFEAVDTGKALIDAGLAFLEGRDADLQIVDVLKDAVHLRVELPQEPQHEVVGFIGHAHKIVHPANLVKVWRASPRRQS